MTYKDFGSNRKTYVVVKLKGNGVMESHFEEDCIMADTDSLQRASRIVKLLTGEHNTKEEKEDGWLSSTFVININVSTKKGMELYKDFEARFDDKTKDINEFDFMEISGVKIYYINETWKNKRS